jgi:hypothetical protein
MQLSGVNVLNNEVFIPALSGETPLRLYLCLI